MVLEIKGVIHMHGRFSQWFTAKDAEGYDDVFSVDRQRYSRCQKTVSKSFTVLPLNSV